MSIFGPNLLRRARRRARTVSLAGDARGVAVIEFAFIAGPLMALLIGIVQVSITFFAQQNLESVGESVTRVLMTGEAQSSGMSKSAFKALACSKLPSFMKCANLIVDVQVATGFSAANTAPPTITFDSSGKVSNSENFAPGGPGDIVIVKTMYLWNTQKGPLGFDISTLSSDRRLLIATSVFKTEPYAT